MDQPMSNFAFSMMSAMFKVRDLLRPRMEILGEVGIKPGFRVLDYGCGPGGYVATAAELVGRSGMVYALDVHPVAIQNVEKIVRKNQLANVKTIRSDCETGLPDDSIDVVLLYDILHMLSDPHAVLAELRRVLKPDGVLSLNEPHMGEQDVLSAMTNGHAFRLARRGERTYSFVDAAPATGLEA
jgi:ubiquinone/menaquinone biosynthesis C-methylase UbiE